MHRLCLLSYCMEGSNLLIYINKWEVSTALPPAGSIFCCELIKYYACVRKYVAQSDRDRKAVLFLGSRQMSVYRQCWWWWFKSYSYELHGHLTIINW